MVGSWPKGKKHSSESRQKMNLARKGKMLTGSHRRKISLALTGKKRPDEVCKKISVSSMGKPGTLGHSGKKHSDEARLKISESKKGKPSWNSGLTKATDSRVAYSRPTTFKEGHNVGSRFGRERRTDGENHYNFQNWKGREPYGRGWNNILKESIRLRDNYKCQRCGVPQEELNASLTVHHIDCVKTNLDPNNLVSLCVSCHTKSHRDLDSRFINQKGLK